MSERETEGRGKGQVAAAVAVAVAGRTGGVGRRHEDAGFQSVMKQVPVDAGAACRGSSGEVRELPAGCARVCGAAAPGPSRVVSRTVQAERDPGACGGGIGL